MIRGITARAAIGAVGATLLLASSGGLAFAHTQTVTPPGLGDDVVSGPISKGWAQAHCQSNAPAVVAEASDGVVAFLPVSALCLPVENPGGQVHP
jgi:hypothetical protein